MPFNSKTIMDQKQEFVLLAKGKGVSMSELCHRYQISRRTGYKWLARYEAYGPEGLNNQSKRPLNSPNQVDKKLEQQIISLRKSYPKWGSKKLRKLLEVSAGGLEGFEGPLPARSTIQAVLKRNGLVSSTKSSAGNRWQRFEHDNPNDLWQMDFKGYFITESGIICYPLTILDDHSRFNLALQACANQKRLTVDQCLKRVFQQYGLPERILADNGSPWGGCRSTYQQGFRLFTFLEKQLMLLGIQMVHGRPLHPQTQGKEERFHRTMKTELLQLENFKNLDHCQKKFDQWREQYNCVRPHEAIDLQVPASLYHPSNKKYPDKIPKPIYDTNDIIRHVSDTGEIAFKGLRYKVGKAFIGDDVALRPTSIDGEYQVFFCKHIIRTLNLNK